MRELPNKILKGGKGSGRKKGSLGMNTLLKLQVKKDEEASKKADKDWENKIKERYGDTFQLENVHLSTSGVYREEILNLSDEDFENTVEKLKRELSNKEGGYRYGTPSSLEFELRMGRKKHKAGKATQIRGKGEL